MEEQVTEAEQEVIIVNNNLLFTALRARSLRRPPSLGIIFYITMLNQDTLVQEWFVKESWKLFQEIKITGKLAKPWTPKIYLEC